MRSIPFIVGFRIEIVSRALAVVLIYEALSSWLWFLSPVRLPSTFAMQSPPQMHIGYVLHAREHFFVNVVCLTSQSVDTADVFKGVAGGVSMLNVVGAGKYTVDELLKKKE